MLPRVWLTSFVVLIGFVNLPSPGRPADPFGGDTIIVSEGPLVEIWKTVRAQFMQDRLLVNSCRDDETNDCDPVLKLLKVVAEASDYQDKALLGHLNRSINLLIKPVPGNWASALESVKLGTGDCKAYSIAKYLALREAGVSRENVRLVIVRNRLRNEDHMIVAVYQNDQWLVLDELTMLLLQDWQEQNYVPLFVLDNLGVRRYIAPVPVS